MARFEVIPGRPLTRVVCLSHQAELPYRGLFRALDGQTTCPSSFSGRIGQMLAGDGRHELPLAQFCPLSSVEPPPLPADVEGGFSSDLRLLIQCVRRAVSGNGGQVAQHVALAYRLGIPYCCVSAWSRRAPVQSCRPSPFTLWRFTFPP